MPAYNLHASPPMPSGASAALLEADGRQAAEDAKAVRAEQQQLPRTGPSVKLGTQSGQVITVTRHRDGITVSASGSLNGEPLFAVSYEEAKQLVVALERGEGKLIAQGRALEIETHLAGVAIYDLHASARHGKSAGCLCSFNNDQAAHFIRALGR